LPQDVPVVEVWNKSDVASVTPAQAGAQDREASVTPAQAGTQDREASVTPAQAGAQGARGARHREPWIPASAGMTGIHLSAKTGAGLEHLRHRLLELAGWQAAPEGVFIARERHLHALRRVDAHLMEAAAHLAREAQALDLLAEELRLAQNALSEITGEFSADDLLGVIFSRFCIGK
jgi:tRNA U34 5-carboxymethylaminomethyl modifying GTPase MnmE/TrmE